MESAKEQEKSYYTLVLDKLGRDLQGTVALIRDAMCYNEDSVIEVLAMLPSIVARGLMLQDAELLQSKLAELGNTCSVCKDTEIFSFLKNESVSTSNEIFEKKLNLLIGKRREESILVKCRICRMLVEHESLEMFCFTSCPHCGVAPLLLEFEYKRLRDIKEVNEMKIRGGLRKQKRTGKSAPGNSEQTDLEESENEL